MITSFVFIGACQPLPADHMKVEILDLDTEQQKQSYAMGANIGQIVENKIAHQTKVGVEYDQNLLVKGFIAALQGQSQLDKLEIQSINRRVETHVREKNVELKAQIDDQNKAEGLEFLITNAKRTGIIVTDSGLQYEILKNTAANKLNQPIL